MANSAQSNLRLVSRKRLSRWIRPAKLFSRLSQSHSATSKSSIPIVSHSFGLIAEQVEKVNPDLVVRGEDGKVTTVRYEAVNAMLLNEFLKEHRRVEEQGVTIAQQKKDFASQLARQQKAFEAKFAQQQQQVEALTATVQKVTAQVEAANATTRVVSGN